MLAITIFIGPIRLGPLAESRLYKIAHLQSFAI